MDAKENTIFIAVLIIAVFLVVIIFYFFISILRRQQNSIRLHKKSVADEINQIEKERSRIAADLHDELGPLLSAIKMKVNSFELADSNDLVQIEKTNEHITVVMQRLREISFDLMPGSLLRNGLITAVKEFVDSLNENTDINFYFKFDNDLQLSEYKSINTYRIIQEIVQNTIKHAHASELLIEIKTMKDIIAIHISDNGMGFDYEKETTENIGFGLRSLLRRTEIINGQMFLESHKNKGTTYNFEIPIK